MTALRVGALCVALTLCAAPARAGGSAETTLVVVNADSPTSLHVANEYVRMRGIPTSHVVRIDGVPHRQVITIEQFRTRIWAPIAKYLETHALWGSVDLITYSTDFPYGVRFDSDFTTPNPDKAVPRIASLNSLTYLARRVADKDTNYAGVQVNRYFRGSGEGVTPSMGFRSAWAWEHAAAPVVDAPDDDLDRYFLSTMLGYNGRKGNTTEEILAYLERSAAADGTSPGGTVYLMKHKDIRSRVRQPLFDGAIEELVSRDRAGAVLAQGEEGQDGKVPIGKDDVIGLVAGIANFDWDKSKSTLLPGAIAEHFTSFGARFDQSGQTKCSAFLRAGAAGTSGTVCEPKSYWMKFPTPYLHVHYADGCSLAEAFYQSVLGPYQLLIVGDGLARPYAEFLKDVKVHVADGETEGQKLVSFGTDSGIHEISAIEVFVDGKLVAARPPGEPIPLDLSTLDGGWHEIRAVGVGPGLVATRTAGRVEVTVPGPRVSIKGPRRPVALDDDVKLTGKAAKAKTVEVLHGLTPLATVRVNGSRWKATIPATVLGRGQVPLVAQAHYADETRSRSQPFVVEVKAPDAIGPKVRPSRSKKKKPKEPAPAKGKQGLMARVTGERGKEEAFPVTFLGREGKRRFLTELRQKGIKSPPSRILLDGEMHVPEDGVYQFAVNATGSFALKLRSRAVLEGDLTWDRQAYVEVTLAAGWHPIEVVYAPKGNGDLELRLGGAQVAVVLGGKALRH